MNNDKIAGVMDRFAGIITDLADELRDHQYGDQDGQDDGPVEAVQGREVRDEEIDIDGLTPDSDVDVNIGNLWRLVNGARYMVRMAREGKVPSMDQRGPLDRAIKALKAEVPALRKGGIGRLIRG